MHPLIATINAIPQHKQKSQEWLNQRKGFLTSSDAASALGTNPYSSYDELVFKKCGVAKPFTGNIATRHGERYEDEAIDRYCSVMGMVNYEFGLIPYKDVPRESPDPELNFLAGSPDGIALPVGCTDESEPIMIEVKCPFRRKPKQGQVPEHYLPQVQLNMLICKCNKADFIEYLPKTQELFITRIHIDHEWLNSRFGLFKGFWKTVELYRSQGIHTHVKYAQIKAACDKACLKETERLRKEEAIKNQGCLLDSDSD